MPSTRTLRPLLALALLASATTAQVNWTEYWSGPPARSHAAMVYDEARNETVLFGGRDLDGNLLRDTWLFDGTRWREATPAVAPSARSGHRMVYVPGPTPYVLLFGGDLDNGIFENDTWIWNGTNWGRLAPNNRPSIRADVGLGYDPLRDRVVLFGGRQDRGPYWRRDVWEWDGLDWSPAPRGPAAMLFATMAWDPALRQLLMYCYAPFGGVGETWLFDGTTWTQFQVPSPDVLGNTQLVLDTVRNRPMLAGGWSLSGVRGDVWEWDGTTGSWLAAGVGPTAREAHAAAFDTARGEVVLFGGRMPVQANGTLTDPMPDTWLGSAHGDWRVRGMGFGPNVSNFAIASDEARQQLVRFGGFARLGRLYGGTWLYDGIDWRVRRTTPEPPLRSGARMVWDPLRERVLMFGGYGTGAVEIGGTWAWDGTSWTELPTTRAPSRRGDYALAHDPERDRTLLFGGQFRATALSDAWEFDGTDWHPVSTVGAPVARSLTGAAYDPVARRIVVHGGAELIFPFGSIYYDETYSWDGAHWSLIANAPSAFATTEVAWDPVRERLVTIGRSPILGPPMVAFEMVNGAWTQATTSTIAPRTDHRLVASRWLDRTLLIGGPGYLVRYDDAHSWDSDEPARYASFGRGCTGSTTPTLDVVPGGRPYVGSAFEVVVDGVPSPVAFLLSGASASSWSGGTLPFGLGGVGAPGCELLVDPVLATGLVATGGRATSRIALPVSANLIGKEFYQQAAVADPFANALGLTWTAGRSGRIGRR